VEERHSETPYTTDRAIDFIRDAGSKPWVLHLSYIKPHWPYVAPAPYHQMYSASDALPPARSDAERTDRHPVMAGFQRFTPSRSFSSPGVREAVIPVYMGLISQVDDHLGRLFRHLEASGRLQDTLVVLTSDHGDYLGDHWLGEKELFHDAVVRVPMIVADPRPRPTPRADRPATRSWKRSTWRPPSWTHSACPRLPNGSRAARCCRSCMRSPVLPARRWWSARTAMPSATTHGCPWAAPSMAAT
jgi:arylsulfatase A-like enzyme